MSKMFHVAKSAALVAVGAFALPGVSADKPAPAKKPKVEVVFCLDTTGSMGGLIDGAKAKVWAICNQVAGGKPTPDLEVGLVAYRDKGDAYVTHPLQEVDPAAGVRWGQERGQCERSISGCGCGAVARRSHS